MHYSSHLKITHHKSQLNSLLNNFTYYYSLVNHNPYSCFLSRPGCPAEEDGQECKNPFNIFQGCMRLLSVENQPVDLIMVQQRLLGNYSHLQIDMCGIIDRSEPPKPILTGLPLIILPSLPLLRHQYRYTFHFIPSTSSHVEFQP